MLASDVVVGKSYKVNAPNISPRSWWIVKDISENKHGDIEVTCKEDTGDDRIAGQTRTFLIDRIDRSEKGKKPSVAKRILSKEDSVVETWGEVQMLIENVSFWPNWGRRGRPKKES